MSKKSEQDKQLKEKETNIKTKKTSVEIFIKSLYILSGIIQIISFLALVVTPFLHNIFERNFGLIIMISSSILLSLSEIYLKGKLKAIFAPIVFIYLFVYIFLINYDIYSNWYWFGFINALLCIFICIIYEYFYLKNKNFINDNNKNTVYHMLLKQFILFVLIDLFYMAFIIESLVWKFIFGGILLVYIYYHLAYAFVINIKFEDKILKFIIKYGFVQDLLICIALTIYLIYVIPNETIQNIVLNVISAVYGGLFTLCGVMFEIRNQEKIRKIEKLEQEKEKKEQRIREITPFIGTYTYFKEGIDIKYLEYWYGVKNLYYNFVGNFKNSDKVPFLIDGIEIDGEFYRNVYNEEYIEKGKHFSIKIYIDDNLKINKCYLLIKDIDLNNHKYKIKFNDEGNFLRAVSIREVTNDKH